MFCYQCQETAKCSGCTMSGVCGKTPDTAVMQDLLVYVSKLLSTVTTQLRKENKVIDKEINHLITLNLFTTITNANFDKKVIEERVTETLKVKEELLSKVKDKNSLSEKVFWNGNKDEYESKGKTVGVLSTKDEDVRSLRELITYGLKGLSAYSKHANVLMSDNEEVDGFLQSALAKTLDDNLSVEELINLTLETGKYGVEGMAMLDKANTSTYGNPEITKVNIGVKSRPGILVSGHDLKDLEILLKQSENSGVDIYTHSEMLPAHYYPHFKKYSHFVGNYGNAWWKQKSHSAVLCHLRKVILTEYSLQVLQVILVLNILMVVLVKKKTFPKLLNLLKNVHHLLKLNKVKLLGALHKIRYFHLLIELLMQLKVVILRSLLLWQVVMVEQNQETTTQTLQRLYLRTQ